MGFELMPEISFVGYSKAFTNLAGRDFGGFQKHFLRLFHPEFFPPAEESLFQFGGTIEA